MVNLTTRLTLKRNTHLVMGGVDVPPKNIKDCLGEHNLEDGLKIILRL